MTDTVTVERRSEIMRRIRGRDTQPELKVRRGLHRMGFRYRLHRKDLPGKPDIVLTRHRAVVFVHGCFWHRHDGCRMATTPASNVEFWKRKFAANVERDQRNRQALVAAGWRVLIVWECETRHIEPLLARLAARLRGDQPCTLDADRASERLAAEDGGVYGTTETAETQ